MGEPFLAEIKICSFNFPPRGWAMCDGQLIAINQNTALFSLLGTTYGGNGTTTFALPDLRGRAVMGEGNGHTLGEHAGEENHTLTISELPAHTHIHILASNQAGTSGTPVNNLFAAESAGITAPYAQTVGAGATMHPTAIAPVGGSQPHLNMQPYLVVNFVIALQGIFPSRN